MWVSEASMRIHPMAHCGVGTLWFCCQQDLPPMVQSWALCMSQLPVCSSRVNGQACAALCDFLHAEEAQRLVASCLL